MSKIVKKETNEVATKNYYSDFVVNTDDLIRPKIALMQKASKPVEEEAAKIGEFRDNISNKLFGDKKTNMIIVPITPIKPIYSETVKDNNDNTVSYQDVLRTRQLPKTEEVAEGTLERKEGFQLICLPMTELEEYVKAKAKPIPYQLTFKGASRWAGKQITQAIVTYKNLRKPPFALSFEISSTQDTWKGNSFYKMEIKKTEEVVDKDKLALLQELFNDMSSINSVDIAEESNEQFF